MDSAVMFHGNGKSMLSDRDGHSRNLARPGSYKGIITK